MDFISLKFSEAKFTYTNKLHKENEHQESVIYEPLLSPLWFFFYDEFDITKFLEVKYIHSYQLERKEMSLTYGPLFPVCLYSYGD